MLMVPEASLIYDKDRNASVELPDPKAENGRKESAREAGHLQRREDRNRFRPERKTAGRPAIAGAGYDLPGSIARHHRDALGAQTAHLLTMFGIAWGIISITVMVAAGEGLGRGIQKQQENFGKDVMIIFCRPHQHASWRHPFRPCRPLDGRRLQGSCQGIAGLQIRDAGTWQQCESAQRVQQRRHRYRRLPASFRHNSQR